MTNINKKDLRKISFDFRCLASRTINASYLEVASIIGMLIGFIDKTPLIKSYIDSCPFVASDEQVKEDIRMTIESYGQKMLSTGSTPEEEVAYTYRLLKIVQENSNAIYMIGNSYCSSRKFKDMTKAFGSYIIQPFANTIIGYLTHIGIDIGMDEQNQYNITVSGGQVNISQNNSTLNAVQNNNGFDLQEAQKFISEILLLLSQTDIPQEQLDEIGEVLVGIKDELAKPVPKKRFLNMLLQGLQTSSTILSTIPVVAEKVNAFAAYIAPYLQ